MTGNLTMDYSPYSAQLPARPAVMADAMRPSSLLAIIARIEEAVDDETEAIARRDFDLKASNARKSRCLYELTRAMRGVGDLRGEQRDGILRLRRKLERNERAIRAHMDAVGEVANIIQAAIQHAETDGTYSSGGFGR